MCLQMTGFTIHFAAAGDMATVDITLSQVKACWTYLIVERIITIVAKTKCIRFTIFLRMLSSYNRSMVIIASVNLVYLELFKNMAYLNVRPLDNWGNHKWLDQNNVAEIVAMVLVVWVVPYLPLAMKNR